MPWNPSQFLRNNLSTAAAAAQAPLNQPVRTLASLTPPGPSAQKVMSDDPGVSSDLRVPRDTPMYYTRITMQKYVRTAWNTFGTKVFEPPFIILPLPQRLIDNQTVSYSTEPVGITGLIAAQAGSGAAAALARDKSNLGNFITAAQNGIGAAAKGIDATTTLGLTLDAAIQLARSKIGPTGQAAADAFMAAAGYAQNEFLTVMLKGPEYKRRDFSWLISPNSEQETFALKNIIQIINNAQAPGISGLGYAFFQYPKIFNIDFHFGPTDLGPMIFSMKPMVLLSANWDYTPDTVYAPFAKTHGPNAVQFQLNFMELELWLNSDMANAYEDPPGATGF